MPTTLVGTECNSKANYRTVAFCSMVQVSPPIVAIGLGTGCYTGKGIREIGGFSINIPSEEMVKETDYCGLVSGKNTDKSTLYQSFFGQLGNVPMITECPLNLE
jgi:flavin reductase (DIM6/NTAB) family NADH-FMN oxidoreductase RutF